MILVYSSGKQAKWSTNTPRSYVCLLSLAAEHFDEDLVYLLTHTFYTWNKHWEINLMYLGKQGNEYDKLRTCMLCPSLLEVLSV